MQSMRDTYNTAVNTIQGLLSLPAKSNLSNYSAVLNNKAFIEGTDFNRELACQLQTCVLALDGSQSEAVIGWWA